MDKHASTLQECDSLTAGICIWICFVVAIVLVSIVAKFQKRITMMSRIATW
ncbi:MAG: hypothetical protein HGA36_03260 [Candidatus Moranbacteria bacterium]|nr:hypothetical protein [Candidatus Moranbacteria bacterium]